MFLKVQQLQKHAQARALQFRKPVILHLAQFAPTQQTCVMPCTVLDNVRRVHVQKNQKQQIMYSSTGEEYYSSQAELAQPFPLPLSST